MVAYSSGNHAQGVAAAARLLGMRATIVMPADAPKAKRERTLALGAEVVPYDRNTEDRAAIAKKIMAERGATLVPPYDDPLIIAGQGTIGAEIVEDLAKLSLEARRRGHRCLRRRAGRRHFARRESAGASAKFYVVEPEGFDDTLRSFASGKREANARMSGTICDALMSNTPGELTFPITRELIGQGTTVTDAEVARAVRYAFRELKLVVEPGGAIGLAALLAGKTRCEGQDRCRDAVGRQRGRGYVRRG